MLLAAPRPCLPRFISKLALNMPVDDSSRNAYSHSEERRGHWDAVYGVSDSQSRSWYQGECVESLAMMDALETSKNSAVIDVGGGESRLVDQLLARGFSDVTVLDISDVALKVCIERVGSHAGVTWMSRDVLTWQPERHYDVWHDRAVFHFLAPREANLYRDLLLRSLAPGGAVILGTFALDGPEFCSDLAVFRYDCEELAAFLGNEFDVIECRRELHTTPGGSIQPFTWIAARHREQQSSRENH